jgi:hypothetical protein
MPAAKKKTDDGSVKVTVFVPRGAVREGDIKRAALLAARDKIPIAAIDVLATIDKASDVKTVDGDEGRDYTVAITFTPRRTTDPEDADLPNPVDRALSGLEPLTPEKLEQATSAEK